MLLSATIEQVQEPQYAVERRQLLMMAGGHRGASQFCKLTHPSAAILILTSSLPSLPNPERKNELFQPIY
ncbi:MAG: hypothetical protein EA367_07405 [Leptolyngbya sp. DLM2.Bin15]|nr:MAG: hypothetical protein EA367_07405 [Leptolyngbya sp. DLM2.Bin15]